jgi:hypothetical protein
MYCSVEGGAVLAEGRITFGEVCEYPDGTSIFVRTTLEIAEGLIVRQADVLKRRP